MFPPCFLTVDYDKFTIFIQVKVYGSVLDLGENLNCWMMVIIFPSTIWLRQNSY